MLLLLVLVLVRTLLHLGLSRPWRPYRWLVRQPYLPEGVPDPRHHRAVTQHVGETYRRLRIAHAEGNRRAWHDQARTLRLLLVNAVLEDLAEVYPEHRYRTGFHRPALVADRYATRWRGGGDSPERDADLVRLIERVRAEQYAPDPLVVVEVVADPAPSAGRETGSAARELTAWADRRRRVARLGPSRTVSVDIGPDAVERARRRGQVRGAERTEPATAQRWRDAAAAAGVGMAALLLVGTVVVLDFKKENKCWRPLLTDPGVFSAKGEGGKWDCVGYTDGSFVFHEDLEAAQKQIEEQNDEILDKKQPYVTVVYFGQLSVSDPQKTNSRLAGVQGELRGLAMRQWEHNKKAADKGVPRIRLLIANAGPGWRHWEEVVKRIVPRMRAENIVAAVGFGQSLTTTRKTIRELSRYALPMVSSTATFDEIAYLKNEIPSDFFFPVAPSNTRLASQAAAWARGSVFGEDIETALAVAYTNDSELYGKDLADKFMKQFNVGHSSAGTELLTKSGSEGDVISYKDDGSSLERAVEQVCANRPDLVYYAGRSADFESFLDGLKNDSRCDGKVTVLGNDDIAQYVVKEADELKRHNVSVYYTPLAMEGAVEDRDDFYTELWDNLGDDEKDGLSAAHAAMAYDALTVVSTAFAKVSPPPTGAKWPVEPRMLLLPKIQEIENLAGVSGELSFSAEGRWYDDKLVQLVRVDEEGKPHLEETCGWITDGQKGLGQDCLPLREEGTE